MIVFFGHQSVGADILEGMRELADHYPFRNIQVTGLESYQPTTSSHVASNHVLIHERLGKNRDPGSKLAGFRDIFDSGKLNGVQVALLKFCYVDVSTQTAAELLLERYQAFHERMMKQHSAVRFAHVTVPLRRLPSGPYALIRRALGRKHPEYEANRAREWFNDCLRTRHADSRALFDLALLESTRRNGRRYLQCDGANLVPSLAPEWTYDGGHLNVSGRSMAAGAFLKFLHEFGTH